MAEKEKELLLKDLCARLPYGVKCCIYNFGEDTIRIKEDIINSDLAKRQIGYGRGGRMQIEKDTVEIKSGGRFGKTTGAPICLEIKNKDSLKIKL